MFFQIICKITELESFLNDGYNPAEKNFSKIRAQSHNGRYVDGSNHWRCFIKTTVLKNLATFVVVGDYKVTLLSAYCKLTYRHETLPICSAANKN